MPKKKLKTRTKVRTKTKAEAAKAKVKPKAKAKANPKAKRPPAMSKWVRLVEKHGVMLASARGVVPNVAEVVAGAPIIGGWWAHPKGKAIFAALSDIDDSDDIRCFKLIDGKITFAHRRIWPALVRLCRDGAIATDKLAAVQQEHLPTGEHRNFVTPFPEWVDDVTAKAADKLTLAAAKQLVAI
ncbi:MAG: hypothetical protein ABJE66_12080 [Deltaproteobacteria bacterium]